MQSATVADERLMEQRNGNEVGAYILAARVLIYGTR